VVTERMIKKMEKEGFFSARQAEPPLAGQTVPSPAEGYVVVFRDYFSCGIRLPSVTFLHEILEAFQL
jgi:hypothetical protein